MAENTKIEWCDHTFNPWEGCQKVGPGCDNCYAETRNARFSGGTAINWGPGAPRRRTSASNWELPKRWNAQAQAFMNQHGRRQRVFCASLADVFDNAVPVQWRRDLFDLIAATPNLDWLLLTKRIGNARSLYAEAYLDSARAWPENVWIGATIVNQAEADRDIPRLLAVPARVRFLSMEPLLGPVSLTTTGRIPADDEGPERIGHMVGSDDGKSGLWPTPGQALRHSGLHWVIAGGESGPGARPMSPDWARNLRDQCKAAGVPFLFKQWGEWLPMLGQAEGVPVREKTTTPDGWVMGHACKKAAGRLLDGRTWDGYPAP